MTKKTKVPKVVKRAPKKPRVEVEMEMETETGNRLR